MSNQDRECERFEACVAPILGDNPTWRESGDGELARQVWQAALSASATEPVAWMAGFELAMKGLVIDDRIAHFNDESLKDIDPELLILAREVVEANNARVAAERKEFAEVRAAGQVIPEPPTGWKLVPIEPTEQMLWDGHHKIDFDRNGQNTLEMEHESQRYVHDKAGNVIPGIIAGTTVKKDMQEAWAAMLLAAPTLGDQG